MKKGVIAAVFCTLALAGQGAMARSLEDVLKEKGVITEEDYTSVIKSRPVTYKLGEGFTFTSPDEKFKGSIGSSLQLRYTFKDVDTGQDSSEFRLRRIKLFFNGSAYTPDLTYKFQSNFADINTSSSNNTKFLEESYINYRFLDEVQLRFGQDKVPFARQELISTGAQQFVDRSFVTDAFKPGYDIGLMLHGKALSSLFAYNLGVFGGVGQNTLRTTNDYALAVRLAVNPLGEVRYSEADLAYSEKPLVSVGANYFMDTLNATRVAASGTTAATTVIESNTANASALGSNLGFATGNGWLAKGKNVFTSTENIDIDTFGIDTVFLWRGLSIQGEYFIGQGEGKVSHKKLRAQGFYSQAGYFLIPRHLEAAVRYAWMDPNRDVSNDLISEVQGALSYYFSNHNLKLQADITNTHTQPARTDDLQYRLQAQIIF